MVGKNKKLNKILPDNLKKEEERPKWTDMNDVLKVYKYYSKQYSWMHLVVAQNKFSKKKYLRLKKYFNWFAIHDAGYLAVLQNILKKGAQELEWKYKNDLEVKLEEVTDKKEKRDILKSNKSSGIPEEILEFIQKFPDFTKKLISLDLENKKLEEILEVMNMTADAISVSGDRFRIAFQELLGKISKEEPKSMMELSDLMEKYNLNQLTSLLNIVKSRLQTIETFEQMIHNDKTYEIRGDKSVHRVLENSMWLVDDKYWIVSSNKSLRDFIGVGMEKEDKKYKSKRPDFVCVDHDNKIIILEIKRPSVELKKEEIDQAVLYLRMIKKYHSQKKPVEVYLIGNTISEEARDIAELMPTIKLQTYQEFLEKCRARYKQYLNIVEV